MGYCGIFSEGCRSRPGDGHLLWPCRLTGAILSLTLQFASLLTIGRPFPVQTNQSERGVPQRRENSFRAMTTAAWVLQHLPCLSRPWIPGPIPVTLIMLGCTCHAQHWHGGVLNMSERLQKGSGACSRALSDYARRGFCLLLYNGKTSKTQ